MEPEKKTSFGILNAIQVFLKLQTEFHLNSSYHESLQEN